MGRMRDIACSPIASTVAPTEWAEEPVVLMLAKTPALALAIEDVCKFLGIRVAPVSDTIGITQTLYQLRPIAALAVTDEIDCAVYDLLMAVADFDPNLPVLMVTDDRAAIGAAVHAAHKLWQLTDLIHLTRAVETRDLIDFLFRAGRKSDTGRMMPI